MHEIYILGGENVSNYNKSEILPNVSYKVFFDEFSFNAVFQVTQSFTLSRFLLLISHFISEK